MPCRMCAQVQYSLLDRRPENFMVPYCQEQGIKLLPYGTVAGGFLSERYLGLPASKCADPGIFPRHMFCCGSSCLEIPLGPHARFHDLCNK